MKTLIIEYELNNITIQINLVTNCKTCVRLVQQQILQLYLSSFIGFKSFIIAKMIDYFLYYVLSKEKLKKINSKKKFQSKDRDWGQNDPTVTKCTFFCW